MVDLHPQGFLILPSLKLTFLPLKMDGWNTTFLLGRPIFRGELLVSGRVICMIGRPESLCQICQTLGEKLSEKFMAGQPTPP